MTYRHKITDSKCSDIVSTEITYMVKTIFLFTELHMQIQLQSIASLRKDSFIGPTERGKDFFLFCVGGRGGGQNDEVK